MKILTRAGFVKVNGETETSNKKKLHAWDIIEYIDKSYVVSEKLISHSK